jgi:DNA-binding transcriptional ArsR family regulator
MDNIASAIADPVRREILMMLAGQPLTAGAIADCFAITRPAISRHLRVLRESGLVEGEAVGRRILYRLDTAPLGPLQEWLAQLRDAWAVRFDALETEVYRTRRDRRSSSPHRRERSA